MRCIPGRCTSVRSSLPVNVYKIYGNFDFREWFCEFVILEIFDFGIVRDGPNLGWREYGLASIRSLLAYVPYNHSHIFLSIPSIISLCSGNLAAYTEPHPLPLAHSAPMA
jgi:hypothetical protein